jgi:hypothetical protein
MSGPIVRTGTNPKYWNNWDNVFGGKKKGTGKTEKKPATASAKKAAVKKTPAKKKGK